MGDVGRILGEIVLYVYADVLAVGDFEIDIFDDDGVVAVADDE